MNDKKLAQKLKQGDRLALNRAMDAYTRYLSAVAWNAMGPAATAEDAWRIGGFVQRETTWDGENSTIEWFDFLIIP